MSGTFRFCITLVVFAAVVAASRPSQAQWLTDNGVVTYDDGFEYDTVGSKPSIVPVGTAAFTARNAGILNVLGPASVGPGAPPAIGGTNYLGGFRPGTNDDTYFKATPSQPMADGDHLIMDAWVNVPVAADFAFAMGPESSDVTTHLWMEALSTPGAAPNTYRVQLGQGNEGGTLLNITYTAGVWQEWKLDWVSGSDTATFTIGGVSETRTGLDPGNLPDDAGQSLSDLRVFSSNFPVQYYVDGEQYLKGDVTHDNIVNAQDIGAVASHWLQTGPNIPGDANQDGIVNAQDIGLIASEWLQKTTVGTYLTPPPAAGVPEPGTLALSLIGLAGLAFAGRRNRHVLALVKKRK